MDQIQGIGASSLDDSLDIRNLTVDGRNTPGLSFYQPQDPSGQELQAGSTGQRVQALAVPQPTLHGQRPASGASHASVAGQPLYTDSDRHAELTIQYQLINLDFQDVQPGHARLPIFSLTRGLHALAHEFDQGFGRMVNFPSKLSEFFKRIISRDCQSFINPAQIKGLKLVRRAIVWDHASEAPSYASFPEHDTINFLLFCESLPTIRPETGSKICEIGVFLEVSQTMPESQSLLASTNMQQSRILEQEKQIYDLMKENSELRQY